MPNVLKLTLVVTEVVRVAMPEVKAQDVDSVASKTSQAANERVNGM